MMEPKAKKPKVFVDDWDDDLQLSQADLDAIDRIPMTGASGAPTAVKARPIESMRKDARFSAAGLDATDVPCSSNYTDSRFLQQSSAFDDSFRPADNNNIEVEELKKKLRSLTGERNILRSRITDHEVSKRALQMQIQKLEYSKKELEASTKVSLEHLEKQKQHEMMFKDLEMERERDRWKRERAELTMLNESHISTVSHSQIPTTPSSIGVRTRKVVVVSTSKSTFGPDHGTFFGNDSPRSRPARTPLSVASQRVPSDDAAQSAVVDQNRSPTTPTVETSVQTDALSVPPDPEQVHRVPHRTCVITEHLVERQLMKLMEISLNDDSTVSNVEEPYHLRNVVEQIIGGDILSDLLLSESVD